MTIPCVQAAGLTDALNDPNGALTVLAPNDEAFGVIPPADLDALLANTDALSTVRALRYMHAACLYKTMPMSVTTCKP